MNDSENGQIKYGSRRMGAHGSVRSRKENIKKKGIEQCEK